MPPDRAAAGPAQLAAGQDRQEGGERHVVGLTGGTITGSHIVDGRVVFDGVGILRDKPTVRRHRFHEARFGAVSGSNLAEDVVDGEGVSGRVRVVADSWVDPDVAPR